MKKWIVTLTSCALLGLVGCGGGSDSNDAAIVAAEPLPFFSTLVFPVRAAYENMMDPGKPIGLNLAGADNAPIAPTTTTTQTQVNWPAWSKFPPPPPEVTVTTIPADLRWTGTITAQRRDVNIFVTTLIPAVTAFTAVDYYITLKRLRDGREYRDALTVFFDADYLPLAAVTLESRLWTWATPLRALPIDGTIGVSSGTSIATSCDYPDVPSLTELGCSLDDPATPEIDEENKTLAQAIPSVWSLQPDTAETGFVTFAYRAPFLDALDGTDSFARSEAIVEVKTRIDSAGFFRGVEYVRIEGPLTIRLRG